MNLIIRTENESNFNWVKKILGEDHSYQYKTIPEPRFLQVKYINTDQSFHALPKKIKDLLKFDKTDFIISIIKNDVEVPIISIEITASKPPSQHIEQRTARMISAAELGVVPIFIGPKKVLNEQGNPPYKFEEKFYNLFHKIGSINKIPFVALHFPDKDGVLMHDADSHGCPDSENENTKKIAEFINEVLMEVKKKDDLNFSYFNNSKIKGIFENQIFLSKNKTYSSDRMDTCEIINTENLIERIKKYSTDLSGDLLDKIIENMPQRIFHRKKSLIFFPGNKRKLALSRLFAHSGDPYAGMLAALDYAFCRIGPTPEERNTNMIFIPGNEDDSNFEKVFASKGFNNFYEKSCPFKYIEIDSEASKASKQLNKISHHLQHGCTYSKERPLKIYSHYCDMIVFKNSLLTF